MSFLYVQDDEAGSSRPWRWVAPLVPVIAFCFLTLDLHSLFADGGCTGHGCRRRGRAWVLELAAVSAFAVDMDCVSRFCSTDVSLHFVPIRNVLVESGHVYDQQVKRFAIKILAALFLSLCFSVAMGILVAVKQSQQNKTMRHIDNAVTM
jgi:hypothetical protein